VCVHACVHLATLQCMQVDPDKPVLVPGDPERSHELAVEEQGGIWYHDNLITSLVSPMLHR
jgi:uridine phosphorylase